MRLDYTTLQEYTALQDEAEAARREVLSFEAERMLYESGAISSMECMHTKAPGRSARRSSSVRRSGSLPVVTLSRSPSIPPSRKWPVVKL